MTRTILSFVLLTFLGTIAAHAYPVVPDSSTAADTLKNRSAVPDTAKPATQTGVDTLVNYSAKDSIVYLLRTRFMNLYGKSEMQYQTLDLKSERVTVNWDDATLNAQGVPDTVKADSTIGKPIMRDGGDEYHGDKILYNFHSRKGKITVGTTKMDNGFYVGDQIKKEDADVLYVADGTYTTCDAKDPHFYFASPRMKVYVHDKVVAEPVIFYLSDVPIFALPFGVFPAHSGRSSGLIMPGYGQDDRYGWYLSHFGYYWAASDYWDIASTVDLYSRGRWHNYTAINYALRYNFGGRITADVSNIPTGEPGDPGYNKEQDYRINISHNQQIDPSSRLDVNFSFQSSTYFRNVSTNLTDLLTQQVYSNATYTKDWENSNRHLTFNISRTQDLNTGYSAVTLPSLSFSQGTIFPFHKQTKTRGFTSEPESEQTFLDLLGFTYGASFNNSTLKQPTAVQAKLDTSQVGLRSISDFTNTKTQALNQDLSLSISPKLGYFTVSPSFSFSDARTWTQAHTPGVDTVDTLRVYRDTRSRIIQGSLSTGVNVSTRFYGMAQPNIFGITAFRQTVTPTFGLSYNKQVYGDNMQKYSMLGSLGVGNNFEMKYQKADSAKTEEKLQLLNVGANVNYDFAKDSMRFSDVALSYRTNVGQFLDISGNLDYNLYLYDTTASVQRRVNRFLLKEQGRFGDLVSTSFSLSTSFKGEKKQKPSDAGIPESVKQEQAIASGETGATSAPKKIYYTGYDVEEADFSIPWNITVGYNFSQSRPDPKTFFRSSNLTANLSFNLTEKWQIAASGSYDFVAKQQLIQSVSITRDLHCWQMSLMWYPMGPLEGYRFELKVKAPQLQDIKITKQSTNRGAY